MTTRPRAASGCRSTAPILILPILILPTLTLLGLAAGALSGCATNQSAFSSPPGSPANVTGNWQFTAVATTGDTTPMGVSLTSTSGIVSGSASVEKAFPLVCINGCCGGPFAQFNGSLSGTVDADGNLALGSTVPGGPVFTMTATAGGGSLENGKYSLTGSCSEQGTMTGLEFPSLNGIYAGTMTSQNTGQSFTISATLNQSTTLDSRGFFNVSGNATLTGYPCISSATAATPLDTNSGFLGNEFAVTMNGSPAGSTLSLSGSLSQDGKSVQASYVVGGGNCSLDVGKGTLLPQ